MLSAAEYEAHCQRIEARRAAKKDGKAQADALDGSPIEIAPGRGDLRFSAVGGAWGYVPQLMTSLALIGKTVSYARLFQTQPWVASAVMRILTLASRVPLRAYRRTGDTDADRQLLRPGQHPIADTIHRPWERASQLQLTLAQLGNMLIHGNSVNVVDSGAGNAVRITPKDWRFCMPIMPWRDALVGFRFDTDMVPDFVQDVPITQVLHCAWWSPMGPPNETIGTSPLQQLGTTVSIEDAAQRYQRASFLNGSGKRGAVTMADQFLTMQPEERDKIKAQVRADLTGLFGNPENAGKPFLFPPGLDWKEAGTTAVEAELISQRQLSREEVAAVYMLSLAAMGLTHNAPGTSYGTVVEQVYPQTVAPHLVLIEQAITTQVVRELMGEDDVFVEYDFSVVTRGNLLQQVTALRAAIGSGLMTPNEGRDDLGRARSDQEGMDEFYLPTNNLSPVGADNMQGDLTPTGKPGEVPPDTGEQEPPEKPGPGDKTAPGAGVPSERVPTVVG